MYCTNIFMPNVKKQSIFRGYLAQAVSSLVEVFKVCLVI